MKEILVIGAIVAAYIYRDKLAAVWKSATGGACCASCAQGGMGASSSPGTLKPPILPITNLGDPIVDHPAQHAGEAENYGLAPLPGEDLGASSGSLGKALSSPNAIYGLRTSEPCTGCN